jgi:hypothetical protein
MIVEFGIPTNKELTFGDVKVGQLFLQGGFIWLKAVLPCNGDEIAIPIIDFGTDPCPSDFVCEYWGKSVKIDKIFDNYSITIKED